MTRVEIISIGNELLSGFTVNSNAAWLGQQMTYLGYKVVQVTAIADQPEEIREALNAARHRADIMLVTGGLGPTHDDITKSTVSVYFDRPLRENKKALANVEKFFTKRNRPITDLGRMQGLIPEGADVLANGYGTASGIGIYEAGKLFIFMPGVPREMKDIISNEGLEYIQSKFPQEKMLIANLRTTGIYESKLADKIQHLIDGQNTITVAYLPKITGVTLRLMAPRNAEDQFLNLYHAIKERVQKYIFSEDNENLETVVGKLLLQQQKTIALAESCTGGLVSHMLTDLPGSSAYVLYNQVVYSNDFKIKALNIAATIIEKHGAVSEETAAAMAENARAIAGTDYGIGITGIAGPGGGTEEKPVGLVFIALAEKDQSTKVYRFQFGGDRHINKTMSAIAALEILRRTLLQIK
jgi:nicotinamide-nucleotide amidase